MPIVRRYGQNGNDTDAAVEDQGTRLSLALGIVFERRDITVVFDLLKLEHLLATLPHPTMRPMCPGNCTAGPQRRRLRASPFPEPCNAIPAARA